MYGIAAQAEYPSEALVQAAKEVARQRLPQPAISEKRYGVGYLIIHERADGDYALVDWWTDQSVGTDYAANKGGVFGSAYYPPYSSSAIYGGCVYL